MSDAINARTHFGQMPSGSPSGFPLTQVIGNEGAEFNAPLAEGFMADFNPALMQQFLNVTVAERETVIQPF